MSHLSQLYLLKDHILIKRIAEIDRVLASTRVLKRISGSATLGIMKMQIKAKTSYLSE